MCLTPGVQASAEGRVPPAPCRGLEGMVIFPCLFLMVTEAYLMFLETKRNKEEMIEDREGWGVRHPGVTPPLYQYCPSSSKGYLSIPRYPEIALGILLSHPPVLPLCAQLSSADLLLLPPSDQHTTQSSRSSTAWASAYPGRWISYSFTHCGQ
jgi:hypothetical protein